MAREYRIKAPRAFALRWHSAPTDDPTTDYYSGDRWHALTDRAGAEEYPTAAVAREAFDRSGLNPALWRIVRRGVPS